MLGEKDQRYENELLRTKAGLDMIEDGVRKKDLNFIKKGLNRALPAIKILLFAHFEHLKADHKVSEKYLKYLKKV